MFIFFLLGVLHGSPTFAQNKATITQQSQQALNQLLKSNEDARVLNSKAVAVLVFPNITKAGLMIVVVNTAMVFSLAKVNQLLTTTLLAFPTGCKLVLKNMAMPCFL
jgi:hypothetical protein